MFGLTPAHLILVLAIALIVVGPGKLPELGSALGKSLREFQKATGGEVEWPKSPTQQTQMTTVQPAPTGPQVWAQQPAQVETTQGQPVYGNPAQPIAYPQGQSPMGPDPYAEGRFGIPGQLAADAVDRQTNGTGPR